MALDATKFQDCNIIVKAFERGAAFSPTEESVFALMTPILQAGRAQMGGIKNQLDNTLNTTFDKSAAAKTSQANSDTVDLASANATGATTLNLNNLNQADEDDDSIFTEIRDNFLGRPENRVGNIPGGILNSECIPCGDRINMAAELFTKTDNNLKQQLLAYFESWIKNFMNIVNEMTGLFAGADKYIDLCALIKWFQNFVCIPDFARMISVLMGLLSKIGFDFTGLFDLILGLVAPLLTPFLSNMLNTLIDYIMLVVRPIECIIDSLQAMIAKLDYNVLFQNIGTLDKHFSVGRRQGDPTGNVGGALSKIPFVNVNVELHGGGQRTIEKDYSTAPGVSDAIKRENAANQKAVDEARTDLQRIEQISGSINASDTAAVNRHNEQKKAAQQKYRNAVAKRDYTAIGRINRSLETVQNNIKSSVYTLIKMLREAIETFEAYLRELFQEFQKLIGEFIGGSGSIVLKLKAKLEIVQMISLLIAMVDAIRSGCDDDDDDAAIANYVNRVENSATVWTDNEGNLHIEEDEQNINNAIDKLVATIGTSSVGAPGGNEEVASPVNSKGTASQRLKSLINFTDDAVLDTEIARTAEALTTPVRVTFKCPVQASVDDAEQVNKWISELQ